MYAVSPVDGEHCLAKLTISYRIKRNSIMVVFALGSSFVHRSPAKMCERKTKVCYKQASGESVSRAMYKVLQTHYRAQASTRRRTTAIVVPASDGARAMALLLSLPEARESPWLTEESGSVFFPVVEVGERLREGGSSADGAVGWTPSCPEPTMTVCPMEGTPSTTTKLWRREIVNRSSQLIMGGTSTHSKAGPGANKLGLGGRGRTCNVMVESTSCVAVCASSRYFIPMDIACVWKPVLMSTTLTSSGESSRAGSERLKYMPPYAMEEGMLCGVGRGASKYDG